MRRKKLFLASPKYYFISLGPDAGADVLILAAVLRPESIIDALTAPCCVSLSPETVLGLGDVGFSSLLDAV